MLLSTHWFLTLLVYFFLCVSVLDDQFKWNDNSIVSYKNWVEGGSADWDIPIMDKCVVLHSSTGKWENISCSETSENGVVCEAAQSKLQSHYGKLWLHCFRKNKQIYVFIYLFFGRGCCNWEKEWVWCCLFFFLPRFIIILRQVTD